MTKSLSFVLAGKEVCNDFERKCYHFPVLAADIANKNENCYVFGLREMLMMV